METRERIKTVEPMVERMGERARRRPDGAEVVYVNVAKWEPLLRRAVLQGGGRWDEGSGLWRIARATAESLGLLSRIVRRRGTTAGAPRKNHR